MGWKRLARNGFYNLLGQGLPLLAAFIAIPLLIQGLGTARFGVLTLAWVIVGYFGLFDLGIGKALTQLVARKLGRDERHDIPALVWAAMTLMLLLGLLATLVISVLSPWLVEHLRIPETLQAETRSAFLLLAVSVPVVISSTGLRGILEAHERFGIVNSVRVPLGILNYVGPLLVLPYSNSLGAIVLVLLATRVASWAAYFSICITLYPALIRRMQLDTNSVKQLLSFGGWMTVSNLVGPLLLYLGRFLIAVLLSAEAVAYFSTPYEVIAAMLIVPSAFVSTLFPTFARLFPRSVRDVEALYWRAMLGMCLVMLPITAIAFVFAKPGLSWWINKEFSDNGYLVAQLLAIGVFINSFGHLSQALVQAYGRPDLTAKLHVAELIAYVPYLVWLTQTHGITGAALAWLLRVTFSTAALLFLAISCMNGSLSTKYQKAVK